MPGLAPFVLIVACVVFYVCALVWGPPADDNDED